MSPLAPDLTVSAELGLRNLLAWSFQVGLVAWAAAVLAQLLPLERPAARLRLWQALLAAALVLPVVQPWRTTLAGVDWSLRLLATGAPPAVTGPAPSTAAPALPFILIIVTALFAGAFLQLARLGLGLGRLRAIRRRARPLEMPAWLELLRARLAPRARFLVSEGCGGPATFGVLRPTVLVPPEFAAMPVERQRAVALHELIHVRRRDWLALFGEELLKATLFFHPAVHWLVGRIRLAREQCVDAEVVRWLGDRRSYLESLVEVARLTARAEAVPAAPFLREHHLRERVELLLKEVPMSRIRTLAHFGVTAGTLVLAGAVVVAAFPMIAPPADAASPALHDQEPATSPVKEPFPAKKIVHVNPLYPKAAKEAGVQGVFLLAVTIDAEGRVSDARVVVSTPLSDPAQHESLLDKKGTPEAIRGDARLGRAALEAVRQWRYEPVLDEDGNPKEVEAILTVRFRLS